MDCNQRRRGWHWLTGLAVPAVVAALVLPSPTRSQPSGEGDKPKDTAVSSYDQITPVLLGQETFQAVMAKDKADKAAVMARQKQAPGGALRPHPAARQQA